MSHKYRRSYDEDDYDGGYRRSYDGRRGRGGNVFKNKNSRGRGGRPFSSKVFDKAVSHLRHNKFHAGNDFEEFSEQDPIKWHKLSIIFGAQVERDWVVNKLQELSNEAVNLINYQNEGRNVVTYFRARMSTVRRIRRQSNDFVDASGRRLTLNITSVTEPSVSRINEDIENKVKICLNNRYSFETKILDLSSFCKDSQLENAALYLPLSRQVVIQFVVRILMDNLSELHGLNVSNNELDTLAHFKQFVEKFPDLKMLDVSFNRLRHDGVLDIFRGCNQIESISVQGNPFYRSQNFETYGTIIRRRFPNLLNLNGKELPPRIKFAVGGSSNKTLPEPTLGFFPTDELQTGVITFLKNYFDKYDSDKRDCLLDMYADDCVLTLCVAPSAQDIRQKCARYADSYFSMSRNLLRVKEEEKRKRMVCHGKLQAVSALARLPKSEHFLHSFRVDVLYNNEKSILMNIVGVQRDKEEQGNIIRVFSRTMQIDAPMVVKIDNLTVSHASMETERKYRDKSPTKADTAATPDTTPKMEPTTSSTITSPTSDVESLARDMMRDTGMNYQFSKQCLSDYDFNYKEAVKAFLLLREANKIPPEAYQQ